MAIRECIRPNAKKRKTKKKKGQKDQKKGAVRENTPAEYIIELIEDGGDKNGQSENTANTSSSY